MSVSGLTIVPRSERELICVRDLTRARCALCRFRCAPSSAARLHRRTHAARDRARRGRAAEFRARRRDGRRRLCRRRRRSCSRRRRRAACRSSAPSSPRASATSCASGLRRRDDDRLGARQQLAERDRDVARSRRHVDDEQRRARPSARRTGTARARGAASGRATSPAALSSRKKPIDISFRSCLTGRDDHLVDEHRLLADAEHVRDRMSVDVGVENADLLAELRERGGEVRRSASTCRRRPCPLQTASTRVDAIERDPFDRSGSAAAQLRRQRLPLLGAHHVEAERNTLDAGHVAQHVSRPASRTSRAADSLRPSARS